MKIKAAVLTVCGAPRPFARSMSIQIAELDLDPPGEGEVLVKVGGGGLCQSDLSLVNGDRPRPVPIVLGYEGAGEIVELGGCARCEGRRPCLLHLQRELRPLPALPGEAALYPRALGDAALGRPAPVGSSSAASRRQAGEPSIRRVLLRRVCRG